MNRWVAGARPRTLPAAIVPVLVGTACAHGNAPIIWWRAGAALVVSLAIQIATNYANDYSDGIRGTDAVRVGPMRLVGSGVTEPRVVRRAALIAFGVAALGGLVLAALTSWLLLGVGAAATRVLAVSIVRDCYSGRDMARVMSLAFIVFLAVPILAPSVGQIIMLFGPWRWVFGGLGVFGTAVLLWTALRLPETLHQEDRLPFSPGRIATAFRLALTSRIAVGYMLAMTLVLNVIFF